MQQGKLDEDSRRSGKGHLGTVEEAAAGRAEASLWNEMVVRQLRCEAGDASLSQRIKILLAVRKGGEVGMIDQERWENVINALELCTSEIETQTQVPCEKCHYHNKEYHGVHGNGCCNMRSLQRDILALLKAQEPRVLRVEEVVLLKQNDVVWLEDYNKKDVIPAIVSRMGPMVICIEFALSDRFISVGYDDYGSRWRCWTSRPTDKQREGTPWE